MAQANPLTLHTVTLDDAGNYSLNVRDDGANPSPTLMSTLFSPLNRDEIDPALPTTLGMDKNEFFGDFGGGPTHWRRMICTETQF